jgi:predicted dehydrogenase
MIGRRYDGQLSMTIGFQIRRATPYVEMVKRVQEGAVGDIVSGELHYFSSAPGIKHNNEWSYDEKKIRNQYHFREMSGGILLDQGIHIIDVFNWAVGAHPLWAFGHGSRKGREEYGNVWSNYQAVFEYPGGINVGFNASQVGPRFGDVCVRIIGTEGIAQAHYSGGVYISGTNEWDSGIARYEAAVTEEQKRAGVFLSALHDADANKGASFIKSIETGEYLNELQPAVDSTISAALAREAATRREDCTWDEVYYENGNLETGIDLSQFK